MADMPRAAQPWHLHRHAARISNFVDPPRSLQPSNTIATDPSGDQPPNEKAKVKLNAEAGAAAEAAAAATTAKTQQRLLSYVPHSGWGNQLRALVNALFLASALNRTLVVPRALKHSDLLYGSCASGVSDLVAPSSRNGSAESLQQWKNQRHTEYAKLANDRPPVTNFLDVDKWHVPTVQAVSASDISDSHIVSDQCINETLLMSVVVPKLQADEASLLQMGSTFTLHAPRACNCALSYRKDLVDNVMALGFQKLGESFDALHLRLDEGRHHKYDTQKLVAAALNADVDRPLFVASDNADAALKVVLGVNQRLCSSQRQCRRRILTQNDLDAEHAKGVLNYLRPGTQQQTSEFMRPLLIDAILAIRSQSFFPSNGSTFSSHIKEFRNCAKPGAGRYDCSKSLVADTRKQLLDARALALTSSQANETVSG